MKESNAEINEVVITALTGNSLIKRTPSPISYISKKELMQQSSSNIIDAIAKQPGIAQITTGNGISKPVVRGLGYNRVVGCQ
jgi:TonB-dependent Receptor Plug Domain.